MPGDVDWRGMRDNGEAMWITPADLSPDPLDIATELPPGGIEYTLDLRQTGPVRVNGRAERIEEHRGPKEIVEDIRLRAGIRGDFEMLCARCLESIPQRVEESFDLIFRPGEVDSEPGERAITEAETEIGYYGRSGLLLEDVVREQVLLSLPDRALCRQDCKGLCPHCGVNLNNSQCNCAVERADPRWSALQGISLQSTGPAKQDSAATEDQI